MITWLMVGLLLFTESACESSKASSSSNSSHDGRGKNESALLIKNNNNFDDEDAYRLTCYTCVNVSDNKMCNEWAIDTPCPAGGRDFCRSLHILDSRGRSVLVSKSCVNEIECSPANVGCVPIDTQKICISCCDTSYCNVESPTNATSATYTRKRPRAPTKSRNNNNGGGSGGEDASRASAIGASRYRTTTHLLASLLYSVFFNRYCAYH
ncbi:hypothetical protein TKK_0019384 [Trichogramma kaykai]|uniref:Ly6/PLAUR domain-containing protein 6B n=1 Tax=Trichogramma kaykai TaxID=54128 RepID=A0ABD2VUA1_9HYME